MRTRSVRRFLPLILVLTTASTGTVLASDVCGVSIVRTLTEAARTAQEHTEPAHKHTRATLAKWEEWGNLYLARHGHPYVPPKRMVASHPMTREEREARFKLECELPPVPTVDLASFDLLPSEDLEPLSEELTLPENTLVASDVPPVIGATAYPTNYPIGPVLGATGGGGVGSPSAPPVVPVVGVTPEPSSWLLLGTGLAAVLAFRKMARRPQTT